MVGINKLSSNGIRYSTDYTIAHENYKPFHSNDIGLIRLQKPIQFNEKVLPIHYSTIEVPVNTELQVFGFGQLAVSTFLLTIVSATVLNFLKNVFLHPKENGTNSENLQVLNVRSISNDECSDDKYGLDIKAHDGHLCTIANKLNEGVCMVIFLTYSAVK